MRTEAELADQRRRVQDMANLPDWAGLLALETDLRGDLEMWCDVYAPLLAVAAHEVGDPHAVRFLDEAVTAGFGQPEVLQGELERAFRAHVRWPEFERRMAANVPPPSIELTDWPELTPAHPVTLDEIAADRLDQLRQRSPAPAESAFQTVLTLLHWVGTRWVHSGASHVDSRDAVEVLERVEAGERFACREYTVVLTQILNARGIPARSVSVLRENHHAGLGRGHEVTEAWVDDLSRWIVLDGQNAMYWVDDEGHPLGSAEVAARYAVGAAPASVVSVAGKATATADDWWPYFHRVGPTGCMLTDAPYPPILEAHRVIRSGELRRRATGSWPDLLELGLAVSDMDGQPALLPRTRHPHAVGFEVRLAGQQWCLDRGEAWPIPRDAVGEQVATFATVTAYGVHRPHPVGFVVR
jgi:transglutaminase-like putative cysteine protease